MHEAKVNIGPQPCVFQLIGHKSDMDADRQVLHEEGEYFAKYHKTKFLETSARSGANVEEAFQMIARDILGKLESGEIHLQDGWDGIKSGLTRSRSALSLSEAIDGEQSGGLCGSC